MRGGGVLEGGPDNTLLVGDGRTVACGGPPCYPQEGFFPLRPAAPPAPVASLVRRPSTQGAVPGRRELSQKPRTREGGPGLAGGVFLIKDDDTLVEMLEKAYDSEDVLQELLARYPNLLAGSQIDSTEPRRWLLVSREAPLPLEEHGPDWFSVDHLFLDQDAIPTLVEVKRSTDPRIRREVVGQMLDYAANAVVNWPVEIVHNLFDEACKESGKVPEQVLKDFLQEEGEPAEFWDRVKSNLLAGRIRLVFVADHIPLELQRVVQFLNQQMDPAEVLAIEVKQYSGGNMKTLVPRVIGLQLKPTSRPAGRVWDEPTFLQALEAEKGTPSRQAAEAIITWAKNHHLRLTWGKGSQTGSCVPVFDHDGTGHTFIVVYTNGAVELQFQWMKARPPFDDDSKRLEFLRRINEVGGVHVPESAVGRRPSFYLDRLTEAAPRETFEKALDWLLTQIRST